jgi:hypothetical protein
MGGEEYLRSAPAVVELLGDRPGDGEAIERRGAAAHFIE